MENMQTENLIVIKDRKNLDLSGITKLDSFDSKEFLLENKDNGFENYKEYAKIINEMTNLD